MSNQNNRWSRWGSLLGLLLLSFTFFGCSGYSETGQESQTIMAETTTESTVIRLPDNDDPHVVDWTDEAYSYEDMVNDLSILKVIYQHAISYHAIGKSVAGRDIYAVSIGNWDADKTFVITGAIHGRENITAKLLMAQIEEWLTYPDYLSFDGQETVREMLERIRIEIVPMVNPDGVMLSQEGLSSLKTEEQKEQIRSIYRSDYSEGVTRLSLEDYLRYWKANAHGVDLNRNYDAFWADYTSMFKPCMANYKGPSPASEPETQAMVAYLDSLPNVKGVLCMHTQGEIIYWNCESDNLSDVLKDWSLAVKEATGYRVSNEPDRDASLSDYCVLTKNIPAITVEVGNGLSPVDPAQFETILEQNRHTWDASIRFLIP